MDTTSSEKSTNIHFSDVALEPLTMLDPVEGYGKMPLVSLGEAVKPLIHDVVDIERRAWVAIEKVEQSPPPDNLSVDESAAIRLYTMEWSPRNKCLYYVLNEYLRWNEPDRSDKLRPFFLYLKLFLTGLSRLPSKQRTIYRGVKADISKRYMNKTKITWWGFSSCTSSINVLETDAFLGKVGTRTMFAIDSINGKDISAHSNYAMEEEILMLPCTQFKVVGFLQLAENLSMIQLQEIESPFPLLEPVTITEQFLTTTLPVIDT